MTDVKLRYWKRDDKDGMIYFATATNAGHARAEADETAHEVTFAEYVENVPPGYTMGLTGHNHRNRR